jgi:hypothetical protein
VSIGTEETSTAFTPTSERTTLPYGYAPRPALVALFGKSEMFWIRLERARKGPPVRRLGRTPLYKVSDVLDWLESQKPRKIRSKAR